MISRGLKTADVQEIKRLANQQDFPFNLDSCIIDQVIEDKDSIVAYGIVKNFAEAIIIVNHEAPKLSRAKALRELMKTAIFGTKLAGLKQMHVFVKDEKLAEMLKKHFGFVETSDIVLVRNI